MITNSDNVFLPGSLVTRPSYHYQVLESALNSTLMVQFEQSRGEDIDVWIKPSCEVSDQFKYWYLGLEIIFNSLIFVRSIYSIQVKFLRNFPKVCVLLTLIILPKTYYLLSRYLSTEAPYQWHPYKKVFQSRMDFSKNQGPYILRNRNNGSGRSE